ncbi:uncharacterized protein LOC126985164 [Eriocheir sinensis]|uniref:uncharacterized protein LOC126985164 n=1 Tax=Eriocheir sinensis TaxID=95602 RepID=UPI0021C78417|nr:uncharacterized protein LOC126985164 [Eriocheir sinensis]
MWWLTAVACVAACVGLWGGAAAEPEPKPEPEPEPLLLYSAIPSWAAQMFGTPQEMAQAAAASMTQRTQISAPHSIVFRPAGIAPSPLVAIRDAQAAPPHVVALRQPTTHNVQLLQRPVSFLPYPLLLHAAHLRVPYHTLPYDTRFRPPALFYPAPPAYTYSHSRPAHLDDDDDDCDEVAAEQAVVDSRPTYVRVGHFPQELPSLMSLRAVGGEGEDDLPAAPAGIAQALMPTFSMVPFTNAKAHPSLRDVQPSTDGAVAVA